MIHGNLMKTFFIIIFLAIAIFSPFGSFVVYAESDGIGVGLDVSGCNNDGFCDVGESVLSCPSDCTPPPGGGGGGGHPIPQSITLSNIFVTSSFTNAFISWDSSVGTISTLRWGSTGDVKEGTIVSTIFEMKHNVEILNLKPGTIYYFTIESRDSLGFTNLNQPTPFVTKILEDTVLPENPTNIKTSVNKKGITLIWVNPTQKDFSFVRIMRHEDFFHGNPFSGKLVYEGNEESFLDINVISGKKYFYTLFSKNLDGRFSSGVATSARAFFEKEIKKETLPIEKKIIKGKTLFKFAIHQYGKEIKLFNNTETLELNGEESIIIDTASVIDSSYYVSVKNSNQEEIGIYTFLFNKDNGRYQSVISPLGYKGTYSISILRNKEENIEILDSGFIEIKEETIPNIIKIPKDLSYSIKVGLTLASLLLLFLLTILMLRRHKI